MTTEELKSKIAESDHWYHKIELPGGITTPGWAPLSVEAYPLPDDLTGKRVLDVGAWDGYWTFECLKRGADFVMAIDDFSDPGDGATDGTPRNGWKNFDLCAEALCYDSARFKRANMSLYDLRPWPHGIFDYVLCFGVLYHCRYPLKALDTLAAMLKPEGRMLVETAILDDYSPYRGGMGNGYRGNQMVMEFYPGNEYGNVSTNWWSPTLQCLGHMMHAAGLADVRVSKLVDNPEKLPLCRGFAMGVAA
jgi:tRNA (mo5U34)-methyltransferase